MTTARNGAARYYRVQPAGLGLDHRSETSSGEAADGLHVFENPAEAASPDGFPSEYVLKAYGDEVVVIEADRSWSNGDVEGVCIDGGKARVVARVPFVDFRPEDWE